MGKVIKILVAAVLLLALGVVFGIIDIHIPDIHISDSSLSVSNFHYCSSINGWRDYQEHSSAYMDGEQVFMYFELDGFEKASNDSAKIYQTLTVLKPDGSPLVLSGITLKDYPMIDQYIDATGKDALWFDNHLTIIDNTWARGKYSVVIKIKDGIANESTSYSSNFTVE